MRQRGGESADETGVAQNWVYRLMILRCIRFGSFFLSSPGDFVRLARRGKGNLQIREMGDRGGEFTCDRMDSLVGVHRFERW